MFLVANLYYISGICDEARPVIMGIIKARLEHETVIKFLTKSAPYHLEGMIIFKFYLR